MASERKIARGISIVLLLLAASWSFARLNRAIAAADLVQGSRDPRGFQIQIVDGDSGEAVRYNACEPLHYVINPALAPPNGVADIHEAVAMTSEASGIRFVYDGETDEVPTPDRPPYQPDRYGDRWAPILFGWTEGLAMETSTAAEGRRHIAAAGSAYEFNGSGQAVYVTGTAVFDSTVTDLREGFGGETWGQAMLHELGHILGLDHVEDAHSVMNPVIGLRPASWARGDRAGLWAQGIGSPCVQTPETP